MRKEAFEEWKKEADKAEYPVTFKFGEFKGNLKTEVQKEIQKTKKAQEHNIPIVINVDKLKLKIDRQGKIIEVEGDIKKYTVTGTVTKK